MKAFKHFFRKHLCIKNLSIDDMGNSFTPMLICKKCNREIGFTYFDGDMWKAFIYPRFKKYKLEIERWVCEYTKNRNNMGNAYGQSWEEVLHNFKQWCKDNISSVGCEEWDAKCEEDSKGCESCGIGETYVMGVDLADRPDISL